MTPSVRLARTAGLYYLAVAVWAASPTSCAPRSTSPVTPRRRLQNVVAHETLVRLSFVADLASATFMVFLVLALYRLLPMPPPHGPG